MSTDTPSTTLTAAMRYDGSSSSMNILQTEPSHGAHRSDDFHYQQQQQQLDLAFAAFASASSLNHTPPLKPHDTGALNRQFTAFDIAAPLDDRTWMHRQSTNLISPPMAPVSAGIDASVGSSSVWDIFGLSSTPQISQPAGGVGLGVSGSVATDFFSLLDPFDSPFQLPTFHPPPDKSTDLIPLDATPRQSYLTTDPQPSSASPAAFGSAGRITPAQLMNIPSNIIGTASNPETPRQLKRQASFVMNKASKRLSAKFPVRTHSLGSPKNPVPSPLGLRSTPSLVLTPNSLPGTGTTIFSQPSANLAPSYQTPQQFAAPHPQFAQTPTLTHLQDSDGSILFSPFFAPLPAATASFAPTCLPPSNLALDFSPVFPPSIPSQSVASPLPEYLSFSPVPNRMRSFSGGNGGMTNGSAGAGHWLPQSAVMSIPTSAGSSNWPMRVSLARAEKVRKTAETSERRREYRKTAEQRRREHLKDGFAGLKAMFAEDGTVGKGVSKERVLDLGKQFFDFFRFCKSLFSTGEDLQLGKDCRQ
ncbi:hypothetical protein HDU83_000892 [Entophlyctis luteolus]|nr:hypothetical protein HDU83_000892 [Entophlyctis luteolus]